jgi:hypothetical protein
MTTATCAKNIGISIRISESRYYRAAINMVCNQAI